MRFDHQQNIRYITLVGCGGTGSQWASAICRVVYDLIQRQQHAPVIRFVDPDRVEAKNVGRQMFTEGEVGYYKAEVLARRFALTLGLQIEWFAESFKPKKHANGQTLLCGAVDGDEGRRALAKADCLWIDAGNHHGSGQVVIGNTDSLDRVATWDKDKFDYLPNAALLFPDLLKPEPPGEAQKDLSCADLVALGEQHLLINSLMAAVAAQYTYKILNHEPVETFISYVNSDPLAVRSIPITPENLQPYFKARLL